MDEADSLRTVKTSNVHIESCASTDMIELSILDSDRIFHVFATE